MTMLRLPRLHSPVEHVPPGLDRSFRRSAKGRGNAGFCHTRRVAANTTSLYCEAVTTSWATSILGLTLTAFLTASLLEAQTTPEPATDAVATLQRGVMNGEVAAIASAVAAKVPIDAPGESRMTALGIAALYGRADALRALIAAGANVSAEIGRAHV